MSPPRRPNPPRSPPRQPPSAKSDDERNRQRSLQEVASSSIESLLLFCTGLQAAWSRPTLFALGSLVYYQASHQVSAEGCSLFFLSGLLAMCCCSRPLGC